MPAYAYLRKSSVDDPSRDVSHEVQERAVRELAERYGDNNGALVLLSDWDKSGRLGPEKRPGYRALLEAIESRRATAIYSYSLSRLARSVPELSRLVALCNDLGIPVRLAVDSVDTSTASGRLLTHVLASVAEFEADVTSERARAAQAAKLARGERLGAHPFGEGEGEDAAAVLAAFAETGSYSGAARLLNERGIRPRQSKRGWWPSSVAVVMRRLDRSRIRESTKGSRAGGVDFILAGLMRCPTCDTRLTGARDRAGRRVRYACRLGCVTPHERVSVTEHLIMPAIRAEVGHLVTPDAVEVASRNEEAARGLEARRLRILDMYERGDLDRAEYVRRLASVADELAKLEARRIVTAVPAVDWSWPPKELNGVLRALFERIELDPATFQPVRFEWRVPEWRAE